MCARVYVHASARVADCRCQVLTDTAVFSHPPQISASVKRISQCDGVVEPKYSTRQAVERKVGVVPGWEELLTATGFHFIYQIKKDVPATIVYPEHDDSGIQRKCQKQLEALLNIPHCLRALASLTKQPMVAKPLLTVVSGCDGCWLPSVF